MNKIKFIHLEIEKKNDSEFIEIPVSDKLNKQIEKALKDKENTWLKKK